MPRAFSTHIQFPFASRKGTASAVPFNAVQITSSDCARLQHRGFPRHLCAHNPFRALHPREVVAVGFTSHSPLGPCSRHWLSPSFRGRCDQHLTSLSAVAGNLQLPLPARHSLLLFAFTRGFVGRTFRYDIKPGSRFAPCARPQHRGFCDTCARTSSH